MTQTLTSPTPMSTPRVASSLPPTLWGKLDISRQQQLAHCLCDLIQRIRAVAPPDIQENRHDVDEREPQDHRYTPR
jgi:hypothetical protein